MFIGAYWTKRRESREMCAARIASALLALGKCDPMLAVWYEKGRSRAGSLRQLVELTGQGIVKILKTNDRDLDQSAIPELGYGAGLWNGNVSLPTSFSATCGSCADSIMNCAVIDFPDAVLKDKLLTTAQLRDILVVLITSFDPDNAVVASHAFVVQSGSKTPWEAGGWLVYRREFGIDGIMEEGILGVVE